MLVERTFTFDEFLAEVQKPFPKGHKKKYQQSSQETDSYTATWTGTKSFKHAMELARHGYPKGVKKMKAEMANLQPAQAPALVPIFAVAGDEVDVERFLNNEPENMVTYQDELQDGVQFIDIYVAYSYHSGKRANAIISRGACILKNIDSLENNGYRCRLIGYNYAVESGLGVQWKVILKEYQEHLELDRMAFALACPSMLRRLSFKLTELHQPEQTNESYGRSETMEVEDGHINIGPYDFDTDSINRKFEKHFKVVED